MFNDPTLHFFFFLYVLEAVGVFHANVVVFGLLCTLLCGLKAVALRFVHLPPWQV